MLALSAAREIAHPPISDFHVGAVGLETETGNLVLGGNVRVSRHSSGLRCMARSNA